MKLPRDLSGKEVVKLLARHYGFRVTRSTGSHMTVTLTTGNDQYSLTVPRHRDVRTETAKFLDLPKNEVRKKLFG